MPGVRPGDPHHGRDPNGPGKDRSPSRTGLVCSLRTSGRAPRTCEGSKVCSLVPFGHVQVRKMIDLKGKKRAWRDCTNSLHVFCETFLSLQAHSEGPSSSACRWIARSAKMCSCCVIILVHWCTICATVSVWLLAFVFFLLMALGGW